MRQVGAFLALLSGGLLCAATPPPVAPAGPPQVLQNKEIELAAAEIDRVNALVVAGALPKVKLEEAQEKLADAQDNLILATTLYGELEVRNLSDAMADEMVAAAQRRLERQIGKVAAAQKLVEDGIASKSSVEPLLDELNMRKINLTLAHTRSKLIGELVAISRYDRAMEDLRAVTRIESYTDYTLQGMVRYEGDGLLLGGPGLKALEAAFASRFDRPLPISADGQSAAHDSLGLDHRGRIDVAVNPKEAEGIWLRHYLEAKRIPYYAFLRAIPGKATGAHIHIGPGSTRLHGAD